MARKLILIVGLVGALAVLTASDALAANSLDQTVDNITSWLQARLVPVGALAVVVGGSLPMIRPELGRRVLVLSATR